jgi:hypothetical protein
MVIHQSLRATFTKLHEVLSQLSDEEYAKSLPILSNASIGQHTRHIIEFFKTLIHGYSAGVVNYDKRKRSQSLETNLYFALTELSGITENLFVEDKEILLVGSYAYGTTEETSMRTSYYREIVFNLEHLIHHMAMIKIGLRQSTSALIPSDFGVAPATLNYRSSIL